MDERRERLIVISVVLLLLLTVASIEIYRMSGLFATPAVSVTIGAETEGVFFEEVENDTKYQLGELSESEEWYSYNGSYGGIEVGYDLDYDGKTQLFSLKNDGSVIADVTITANDFSNPDSSDYIDVDKDSGYVRIYIPSEDWYKIPDYDDEDSDSAKNDQELCIANDLEPRESVTGFDFEVKAPTGLSSGNYTGQIAVVFYDNSSYSPCTEVAKYVTP